VQRLFDEQDKTILVEDLSKLQQDYLDYLEDNDEDEEMRYRLYVISWLKNVIITNKIDVIEVEQDDESIFSVDVD
jgi:hypothetical protein